MNTLLLMFSTMTLSLTSYQSIPSQTDDTPYFTSINWRTSPGVVAISQDLLRNGTLCYGDVLVIPGYGARVVSDVMNERHAKSADIWVETPEEEKAFVNGKREIAVIRMPERECTRGAAMAMVNSKKIRKWLAAFKRDNGREATLQEFQKLYGGRQ